MAHVNESLGYVQYQVSFCLEICYFMLLEIISVAPGSNI